MKIALRLVALLAKISLDRLIGSARVDEAVAILQDWWRGTDEPSRDRELSGAKQVALNVRQLEDIIRKVVAAQAAVVTADQMKALRASVRSDLKALPEQLGPDSRRENFQRWAQEWVSLPPATPPPPPGSQAAKLFDALDGTPTSYRQLWQRARFEKDPFLRTTLRKWAKAGWADRILDVDGATELWSVPIAELA
jgi:hypothetical protein